MLALARAPGYRRTQGARWKTCTGATSGTLGSYPAVTSYKNRGAPSRPLKMKRHIQSELLYQEDIKYFYNKYVFLDKFSLSNKYCYYIHLVFLLFSLISGSLISYIMYSATILTWLNCGVGTVLVDPSRQFSIENLMRPRKAATSSRKRLTFTAFLMKAEFVPFCT